MTQHPMILVLALLTACGPDAPDKADRVDDVDTDVPGDDDDDDDDVVGDDDDDDDDDDDCTPVDVVPDADGDGFGDADAVPESACSVEAGFTEDRTDCDDTDDAVFPGNPELCNDVDDDCSGIADDGLTFVDYYPDGDGDGFAADDAVATSSCAPLSGMVTERGDCADTDDARFPGNPELCNGHDEDCVDGADNGLIFQEWYVDIDGDGFAADDAVPSSHCAPLSGHVLTLGDCDDDDDGVHPDVVPPTCDWLDVDCDGSRGTFVVPEMSLADAAASVGGGDVICVGAGIHPSADVYVGPGVTLQGEGRDVSYVDGGGATRVLDLASADVYDLTVQNGFANSGAGINITGVAHLERVKVRDNLCIDDFCTGVGVHHNDLGGVLTLVDVEIVDGLADPGIRPRGVGLYFNGDAIDGSDVLLRGNRVDVGTVFNEGGGGYIKANTMSFDHLSARQNRMEGAHPASSPVGVGLYLEGQTGFATADFVQLDIRDNHAVDTQYSAGVGMYSYNVNLDLRNTIVAGNTSNTSGAGLSGLGLKTVLGSVTADHVVVTGNEHLSTAGTPEGLGWWNGPGDLVLTNSSIDHNTSQTGAGTGFAVLSAYTITHTNTFGNSGGPYKFIFDPTGFNGNISVDPGYASLAGDPVSWDLSLGSGSPLINAGTGLDVDGSTADIGAYGGPDGQW